MAAKKSSRKYGTGASRKVGKAMHERKHGTLRSGGSGKKVTSKKQAIAIGLSEARRDGEKVPPKRRSTSKRKSSSSSSSRTPRRRSGRTGTGRGKSQRATA